MTFPSLTLDNSHTNPNPPRKTLRLKHHLEKAQLHPRHQPSKLAKKGMGSKG
jgi:hypothetical protein